MQITDDSLNIDIYKLNGQKSHVMAQKVILTLIGLR